jgi:serine/threonine-protein kinase
MLPATGARRQQGRYEPLCELATGGMATVSVARHAGVAGFERLVVIKRVHKRFLEDREFYTMLVDEARVASLIRHPNVVPVIDVVEENGELLLVLEYIESISLAALLGAARRSGEPLPAPVIVRIVSDCLSGLHAAHEAVDIQGRPLEVVHRDVSPQNIIVGLDGTSRLIDFGIAKAARRLTATMDGVIKGKSGFMAPEQLKLEPLDRRADVFSAGIVLYVALTGRLPFQAEDEGDLLLALLMGQATPPSSLVPGLPPSLDAAVEYAIAPIRDERFQTAAAFLQALETAVPPAPAREVARFVTRYAGEQLAARRADLRAILEQSGQELPQDDLPDDARDDGKLPLRKGLGRRGRVALAGLLAVVAVSGAAIAMRRSPQTGTNTASIESAVPTPASSSTSAPATPSSFHDLEPRPPTDAPTATAVRTEAPPRSSPPASSGTPRTAVAPRSSRAAPPTPNATSELRENPYGSP